MSNYSSYFLPPDTEIRETTNSLGQRVFSSSTEGFIQDNPRDPFVLDSSHRRRTIAFTLRNTSSFTVTFIVGDGPMPHGRNFLFINAASAIQPPCVEVAVRLESTYKALPFSFGGTCLDAFTANISESGAYALLAAVPPRSQVVRQLYSLLQSHSNHIAIT